MRPRHGVFRPAGRNWPKMATLIQYCWHIMFRKPGITWSFFIKSMVFCAGLLAQQAVLAADRIEKNGDTLHLLILAAGLGSTVVYEEGHEGTIQLLKSFIVAKVVTEGLKRATHKTRPNGNCCSSFPSAHTSKAFMGAGFMHKRYGLEFAIPAYIAATYVAYSRVHADQHFVEDVVAGAAIGILSSFYFTTSCQGFAVTPVVSNGVYGVYVSSNW